MGLGGRMFAALWASRTGLEAPAPSPTNGRRPRPRFSRAAALIFVGRDRFDGLPWQRIPVTLGDRSPQMGAAETVDRVHGIRPDQRRDIRAEHVVICTRNAHPRL